jgi:hypothetical protein
MRLLIILFTFNVYSATTAFLTISGVIPQILNIQVIPQSNTGLDLSTTQNDLLVARVNTTSNSTTGFSVFMRTVNAGNLSDGNQNIPYTAKFNNIAVILSNNDQIIYIGSSGIQNDLLDLTISYIGQDLTQFNQGIYSDDITFTIQAN